MTYYVREHSTEMINNSYTVTINFGNLEIFYTQLSAAADRHDRPYCIVFSYWQRRISTVLQKFNARILYLAKCKIDGRNLDG